MTLLRSDSRLWQLRHLASRLTALESGASWYIETGDECPPGKFLDQAFQSRRRRVLAKVSATLRNELAMRHLEDTGRNDPQALETWRNLWRDARLRGVRVTLAQVEKTYRFAGDEVTYDRFEASYATNQGVPLPVTALFGVDGKLELYLHGERVPGLFATFHGDTQAVWLERVFGNDRKLLGEAHASRRPFTLPLDWTGEVEVRGLVEEADGSVSWASDVGKAPAFHGVYARRGWGGFGHVADFDSEADAQCFAQCLQSMHRTGTTAADLWDRPQGDPSRENWGEAWEHEDYMAAHDEGWGVGVRGGAIAIVPLPSEASAGSVQAKAADGSPLHLKAMLYVLSHAMHGQFGSRFLAEVSCAAPLVRGNQDGEDVPAPTP